MARERADDTVSAALPKGYLRPATQAQWRASTRDVLDRAPFRADRHATLVAVATALMNWADWDSLTTRPTWAKLIQHCRETTGRGSRATIARALATLIELHLIARVAHGRKGCYAPGDTSTNSNEAALYVLIVPSHLRQVPARAEERHPSSALRVVDANETPPQTGLVSEAHPVRARGHHQSEPLRGAPTNLAAQAPPHPRPASDRNVPVWPGSATTGTDGARLSAAAELQRRLPVLRQISTRDVRACLREYFLAGWTVQDVHHALDWMPDGTRWPHDGANGIGPTGVRGWLAHRLAPWTTEGTPRMSFSQRAEAARTEARARQMAEQEREKARRAEWASSPPPVFHAARAHLRHLRLRADDPTCAFCRDHAVAADYSAE